MYSIRNILLIIAIPLVLYILNLLSFIFIPLAFGFFGALLFTPLIRWFTNKKLPRFFGLIMVVLIVSLIFRGAYEVIHLATQELENIDAHFIHNFTEKFNNVTDKALGLIGIEANEAQERITKFFKSETVVSSIFSNVGIGLNYARDIIVTILMSVFFMILFLMGSIDIEKVMEKLIFKEAGLSKNAFRKVEKDIFMFVIVKIFMSLITGVAFSIILYTFGVSFPIFWGVVVFLLNFIQLIGSILAVGLLSVFAMIELGFTGGLVFFILLLVGIEVIVGGILEPILMGKSFSINTITILVMLAIWGFVWGIPGMILSIPITVLLKIILDRIPSTKTFSELLL